ncbi:MAG TPA: hypothetical protein VF618_11720 [Thermoanaerobaculia bacterium]
MTILRGALIVGTLDIVEVILFYWFRGVAPSRVLQGVARGIGSNSAAVGLALHFLIAAVVVAVYVVASRRIEVLRRRPVLMGALYGVAVLLVMNWVVVPLSAIGAAPAKPLMIANLLFAHIFCVGIPTGLVAARGR